MRRAASEPQLKVHNAAGSELIISVPKYVCRWRVTSCRGYRSPKDERIGMEEGPVASKMLGLRAELRKNKRVKTSIIDDDREVNGTSCPV